MKLHPDWNAEDRHNSNLYFASPSGQKLIQTLIGNRPAIAGNPNGAQAWEECINMVAVLLQTDPNSDRKADGMAYIDVNQFSSRPVNHG